MYGMDGISRVVVMDQVVPELRVGRVEVRRIRIEAGAVVGAHVHNGPVFGSIEEGAAVYRLGDVERVLNVGDVFYEPAGERIARFDALEDGVTFLAYFPLEVGQEAVLELLDS